ncbi:hypothetical protein [Devosia sp.]|uniref:hypothetical protein n=1 Tax=Devosia sp. TaxID=1871048 RepID=UPI003A8E643B
MTTNAEIAERLQHYVDNIERWRAIAADLKPKLFEARQDKAQVDRLVGLEETATEIYAEIAAFQATVSEIAEESPEAAAQLAGVGDALQLVLLEITELGIGMYQTHSGL